jgi:hypothetical protein
MIDKDDLLKYAGFSIVILIAILYIVIKLDYNNDKPIDIVKKDNDFTINPTVDYHARDIKISEDNETNESKHLIILLKDKK